MTDVRSTVILAELSTTVHSELHLFAPVPLAPDRIIAQFRDVKRRQTEAVLVVEECPMTSGRVETEAYALGALGIEKVEPEQENPFRWTRWRT